MVGGGGAFGGLDVSAGLKAAGGTNLFGSIPTVDLSSLLPKFAAGGRPRGLSIVGERGAELFMPDGPGTIFPAPQTNGFMKAMGSMRPANDRSMPPVTIQINAPMSAKDARITGGQAAIGFQRELARAARNGIG